MIPMVAEDDFCTDDLTMTAMLVTLGFDLLRSEKSGTSCVWYFTDTDKLIDEVDKYNAGAASVEPKALIRHRDRLRREMFDLLDGRS